MMRRILTTFVLTALLGFIPAAKADAFWGCHRPYYYACATPVYYCAVPVCGPCGMTYTYVPCSYAQYCAAYQAYYHAYYQAQAMPAATYGGGLAYYYGAAANSSSVQANRDLAAALRATMRSAAAKTQTSISSKPPAATIPATVARPATIGATAQK